MHIDPNEEKAKSAEELNNGPEASGDSAAAEIPATETQEAVAD